MKGAVISLGSKSSRDILEAMKNYFDEVEPLQLRDLYVELTRTGTQILHSKEKEISSYDCVYLRGSFRYCTVLVALTTSLWDSTYLPLEPRSFTIGHDKFLTHLSLMKYKVPMPRTYIVPTIETAKRLLKEVNYPIIMKFPHGTQGKGVMFAESYASAASTLDVLSPFKHPLLIQEYIETDSTDVRALVVGNRVVASMRRIAEKDEKRANIHMGGRGEAYRLSPKAKKISLRSAEAVGADICAVDLLETQLGPLVIEVNLSPGIQGLTNATGKDIADNIAKFLFERTTSYNSQKKKTKADKILQELDFVGQATSQELMLNAEMRGDRLVLPEILTTLSKLKANQELIAEVTDGKILLRRA